MNSIHKTHRWIYLVLTIILVELIGGLSGILAGNIRSDYLALQLPPLAPPAGLFGIVWPILYCLIGISGFLLVLDSPTSKAKTTNISLFIGQLFLNFIWSIIFFAGNLYWLGLAVIILLDITVAVCIKQYYATNKYASYLLIPYLAWILFATYLTFSVAILN
ncbi:TspO/MBR family protein [Pediococcus argentinicus]|uniref:Sensory protein n=1 Tax=Pediococcus argentinicus TaxID=480391 RepID=A0A0R2NMK1_9LACO|nr:TspO/MBR family protein [Pediococcus argentinicus]KRO25245.1 sensory protein [Pediococcus argentinicus]NKZ22358.1 tryptophan-rich sensory protein [Pediococcus argentinicus]GEP19505.1 tryptophan-rich sensory protein [Pediococcus argentinicus]